MITLVVGARPNFMKIAPLVWEFRKRGFRDYSIVHTGQHYDYEMSRVFFEDLLLPDPDHHLGVGSGTHSEQTARIMLEFDKICLQTHPELVVVTGDVNSTLGASLVTSKLRIPLAHIEAGLRSFDRSMPEEINRVVTDHLSDILFVSEHVGLDNLAREGINHERVFLVGNIMIDALAWIMAKPMEGSVPEGRYAVATIHRPANVDTKEGLTEIIDILSGASHDLPVLFFAHPRTIKNIGRFQIPSTFIEVDSPPLSGIRNAVYMTKPLGYREFMRHVSRAAMVITDSGGLQAETTFLKIPCVTLRNETEMPVTVDVGTNTLVGRETARVMEEVARVISGKYKKGRTPDLWDGLTGVRIADILLKGGLPPRS